jgi:hypothetical protein
MKRLQVIFFAIFCITLQLHAQQYDLYRGVYVDRFDRLLEDTAESRAFLQWAQRNNIRHLSCYDLYTVLSKQELTDKLVAFMKVAREQYDILSFDAVAASAAFLIDKVYAFNIAHKEEGIIFSSFNLEREWWTEEVSFTSHTRNMQQLRTFISDSSLLPGLSLETYIGWFGLVGTSKETEAMSLIQYADVISVSAYQKNPRFSYLRSRLEELAKAASQTHKKQDIVILFSMEEDFSGKYSRRKSYQQMYDALMEEYNSYIRSREGHTMEKYLNIKGWKVFAQSYARKFRP